MQERITTSGKVFKGEEQKIHWSISRIAVSKDVEI